MEANKGDMEEWFYHPATKVLYKTLREHRDGLVRSLAIGAISGDIALEYKYRIGQIQSMDYILNNEWCRPQEEDLEDELHSES